MCCQNSKFENVSKYKAKILLDYTFFPKLDIYFYCPPKFNSTNIYLLSNIVMRCLLQKRWLYS